MIAKGKKIVDIDLSKKPVDWATLADSVLGNSGNLRAPTIRVGDVFYVGFSEDAWRSLAT